MTQRSYSLSEIDQMRRHIDRIMDGVRHWPCGGSGFFSYGGGSHDGDRRYAEVEDRLRTYMMAGVDPKEIASKVADMDRIEEGQMRQAWEDWEASRREKGLAIPKSPLED